MPPGPGLLLLRDGLALWDDFHRVRHVLAGQLVEGGAYLDTFLQLVAARGLATKGIRVNAVAPALMLPSGEQDRTAFDKVHALNPLGYGVAVDDLLGAIRFLVEQKGVTGQTVTLDGGQLFLALPRDVAYLDEEGND